VLWITTAFPGLLSDLPVWVCFPCSLLLAVPWGARVRWHPNQRFWGAKAFHRTRTSV